MKHFIIRLSALVLVLLQGTHTQAQDLSFQWVKGLTGVGIAAMHADAQKNIYIAGSFTGTVDFDPGTGSADFTATGTDGYVAKYDAMGNYVSCFQVDAGISGMHFDNSGNISVLGTFSGTIDLDPGATIASITSIGGTDIFAARYDVAGNYINGYCLGGTVFNDYEFDATGNIYVTGAFSGAVDFGAVAGALTLTATGGNQDIFLAKYTTTGTLVFAFRLGTSSTDRGEAVDVDAAGNIVLGGHFLGNIDLDPGTGSAPHTSTGIDGFVARYDNTGKYLSSFSYDATVYFLGLDANDNMFVAGTLPDSADVDPGPGVKMLYSPSLILNDWYLSRFDAAGKFLTATAFRSDSAYTTLGLAITPQGSAFLYGGMKGSLDLNPGGTPAIFTSLGSEDAFAAKMDSTCTYKRAVAFGSTAVDRVRCMVTDADGGVWISGTYYGTVDFDPGAATTTLTGASGGIFFGRYTDPDVPVGIISKRTIASAIKVYGANHSVFVDFTALSKVDARIKVSNMLGQVVTQVNHNNNDIVKLSVPDAAAQVYIVTVTNENSTTSKKIWME